MFFILILRFLPGNHHGTSVGDGLHGGDVFWVGSLALMLVLDVSVEGGITQISFTTRTDVISLGGFVSGPALSLVLLDDGHLVALVVRLLLVHLFLLSLYYYFLYLD